MTDTIDLSLLPVDNARLANLCGAMDKNIKYIAHALSVTIKRRGGNFQIAGAAAATAAATLRTLYRQANKDIADDDVRIQLAQSVKEPQIQHNSDFKAYTQAQQAYWDTALAHSITMCLGPAGTGKTHIAVAAALQLLETQRAVKRLVLSRPVVEAAGERLGFLPGDIEQKVNPYLRPLHEILYQLLGRHAAEARMACGEIEIIPLAFMRGLTLNNTVLIVDEAQNTTPAQMKMLLTRLGNKSRIIITGDASQSDIPATSGLSDAAARLAHIDDIALHYFSDKDIVRHPLVRDILRAYADK